MSRLQNLQKNQDFIKTLQFAFHEFETAHNVTASQYFSNKLNYKTPNQFLNNFQPFNETYLKVDELFIILDNLGANRSYILDFICNKYKFTAVPQLDLDLGIVALENSILQLPINQGNLFNSYFTSISDKKIDTAEYKKMKDILYILKQNILTFDKQLDLAVGL
jgi:hypothetical protein